MTGRVFVSVVAIDGLPVLRVFRNGDMIVEEPLTVAKSVLLISDLSRIVSAALQKDTTSTLYLDCIEY